MRYLVLLALGCLLVWAFSACAVKRTRVVSPDGSVTMTEERRPALKQDTKRFIAELLRAYSPGPLGKWQPQPQPQPQPKQEWEGAK